MLLDHATAFETYLSVDNLMTEYRDSGKNKEEIARPTSGGVLPGTLIETDTGFKQARNLLPGDFVFTQEGGLREVVNIRHSVPRLSAMVHVPAGVLGNDADIQLPSDTLIGLDHDTAEELFGFPVVQVKLIALIGHNGIRAALPQRLARIHLQCEEEEIVWAEGGMLLNMDQAQEDGYYKVLSLSETRRLVAALEDEQPEHIEPLEQMIEIAPEAESYDPLDALLGRHAA